jgi:hypothetical protein
MREASRSPTDQRGCTLPLVPATSSSRPRSADVRLRGALLLPVCALAVHQLRYYLAFGSGAPARLTHEGHAYLASIEPFALLVGTVALGGFIGRLARAWQRRCGDAWRTRGFASVWALCAAALVAIYCGQELFEGFLSLGHPAGLAGILGHGGWIAVPVSIAVGGGLAATLKLAETLIELAARRHAIGHVVGAVRTRRLVVCLARDWRLEPESGVVAGRGPPLTVSLM